MRPCADNLGWRFTSHIIDLPDDSHVTPRTKGGWPRRLSNLQVLVVPVVLVSLVLFLESLIPREPSES